MNAFNTMKKCGFGDYIYHIVTFNLDGGIRTGGGELLQRLLSGKDATPPVFTKTLYSFREWDSPVTDIVTSKTIKALYDVNVNVQFVAIGSNSIIISADGVNWLVSLADIGALFGDNGSGATGAICWNGSMFVAGGGGTINSRQLAYSFDGIYWFPSPTPYDMGGGGSSILTGYGKVYAICWNGSMFVAGGICGQGPANVLVYSYDGINWSLSDNADIFLLVGAICWNGSMFVAVGQGSGNTGSNSAYSTDGIHWTRRGIYPSTGIGFHRGRAICWNGSMFVAGGNQGDCEPLVYSYDGINWTASTNGKLLIYTGNNGGVGSICWNGSMFVAGCFGSNVAVYSYDGINWLNSDAGNVADSVGSICWNGSMFVAGGSTGAPSGQASIIYSYNGVNWFASPSADALMPNMCSSVCSKNAPNLYPPTNSDVMTNISYNITFNTGVGTWNDDTADNIILSVSEGYLPVYPTTIKAPTGYYATGWSPSLAVATENKTYTAQFAEIIPLNTVYFDLAGGTRTGGGALSQSVADNGYATEPTCSPPISHHPDHRNFTWIGWDTALGPITGNTTITALWQMNEF